MSNQPSRDVIASIAALLDRSAADHAHTGDDRLAVRLRQHASAVRDLRER